VINLVEVLAWNRYFAMLVCSEDLMEGVIQHVPVFGSTLFVSAECGMIREPAVTPKFTGLPYDQAHDASMSPTRSGCAWDTIAT
jgi:hypothetical protein